MNKELHSIPVYELYAIRYAHLAGRRRDLFAHGDPHDGPMDVDYFIWVAIGEKRSFVVDIGFSKATGDKRNRNLLRCPIESLRLVGLDPTQVRDVVITHLHYDHAGNFKLLPAAKFHIQEPEVHFASGRHMCHSFFRGAYEVEDIVDVVRLNYAERVVFYNGCVDLAPGIVLEPMPGHTPGQQIVRVHTKRGWIVLLSDASHFFENILDYRPFSAVLDMPQMVDSFHRILRSAGGVDRMIPGHDPLVMKMYPAASAELQGVVVRLDEEPDMSALPRRLSSRG
jgi:glyoxylase-like metal-dependent hydrolase (beta-lactamase superfamily II)